MNVKGIFDWLGIFPTPRLETKSPLESLKSDQKELYDKIVKNLLLFYGERLEHPNPKLASNLFGQECALIFRQSKSWRDVEKILGNISVTDVKTKEWVTAWLKRISTMRSLQTKIHILAQRIQNSAKKLKALPSDATAIAEVTSNMIANKKLVADARKRIGKHLADGKKDLDNLVNLNPAVAENGDCKEAATFISDNWLHLCVFSDWPEVSLDEERLAVQVQRLKETITSDEDIPFDTLVNASTKAIFLIKQSDQDEIPFEYEGVKPGKIIRTTRIELKNKHFAPESPSPKKRSSSTTISDVYIFNTDFAQAKDDKVKTTSATARKLERVVKLALRKVNSELSEAL